MDSHRFFGGVSVTYLFIFFIVIFFIYFVFCVFLFFFGVFLGWGEAGGCFLFGFF